MLAGGAGAALLAAAGTATMGLPRLRRLIADERADRLIPSAPLGDERLVSRESVSLAGRTDFYLAVPDGHGDGAGLPVCLVLHGASATVADFPRFGLGRFLTDAARRGAPPFALAAATGPPDGWQSAAAQRLVSDELPRWCADRHLDNSRIALWGWSRGGAGLLRLAEAQLLPLRAIAAFSPAIHPGDAVFADVDRLRGTPVGLWCGRADELFSTVRAFAAALPDPPIVTSWGDGGHARDYWNGVTPAAFDFIADQLARPSSR